MGDHQRIPAVVCCFVAAISDLYAVEDKHMVVGGGQKQNRNTKDLSDKIASKVSVPRLSCSEWKLLK